MTAFEKDKMKKKDEASLEEMKEWLNLSDIVKEKEFESLLKKHELTDVNKSLQHPRKRIN